MTCDDLLNYNSKVTSEIEGIKANLKIPFSNIGIYTLNISEDETIIKVHGLYYSYVYLFSDSNSFRVKTFLENNL